MTLRSVFTATLLLVAGYAHAEKGSEPPACVSVGQVGPVSCVPAVSTVEIEVTLTADCSPPIQALGFSEELPPGWMYKGVQGDQVPVETPALNATGTLEFIWLKVPSFPVVFTLTVAVPVEEDGPQTLTGRAEYRQLSGALFSDASDVTICIDGASEGEGEGEGAGEGEGCALPIRKRMEGAGEFLGALMMGGFTLVVLAGFRSVAGRGSQLR